MRFVACLSSRFIGGHRPRGPTVSGPLWAPGSGHPALGARLWAPALGSSRILVFHLFAEGVEITPRRTRERTAWYVVPCQRGVETMRRSPLRRLRAVHGVLAEIVSR